jgi:hypothetical protein
MLINLKKIYTGDPYTYDVIGSWSAVISQTHMSHKCNVINCSSIPGHLFHTLKSLKFTKKMEENYVKYWLHDFMGIY